MLTQRVDPSAPDDDAPPSGTSRRRRLEVRLLGAVEVILDGRRLGAFDSLRFQRFLALIALRRDLQHRSRLAFELWPDSDERQARNNLSDLAHRDDLADKALVTKARRKLADRGLEGRAMTPAMVDTPRERLVRRARRGRWAAFPVDPQRYYASFRRHVELKRHVSKNRSFAVVDRLEERLEHLDGSAKALPERLGLYRAFHTAGLELAERADDSFGVVGELRQRAWQTYLGLDWRAAGVGAEAYWADLCELAVWEDYGLGFQDELRPFAHVAADEVDLVERVLVGLEEELAWFHLEYQAEAAATQIGWLHVAGRRPNRYEATAARIGSRNWQPVVAMAESALDAGRQDLAVAVYRAAGLRRG